MDLENSSSQDFLPSYEPARLAVERARQIVKDNNAFISRIKSESNIESGEIEENDKETSFGGRDFFP